MIRMKYICKTYYFIHELDDEFIELKNLFNK